MAHIGSFVPAKAATIGLTDKILTRIATRETVSRTQSSFMIDLQQVSIALKLATYRSLLVLDEFGKGTNSSDGAALACSVFHYLLNLGDERPKVLGATHYHEMFESGSLQPRPELELGYMEVRLDSRATQAEDQVTYLYTFRKGRSSSSYGTICAEMNGIPTNVVARAEQLTLLAARGEDLLSICAAMSDADILELQEAEKVARSFLSLTLDEPNLKELLGQCLYQASTDDTDTAKTTSNTEGSSMVEQVETAGSSYFRNRQFPG
jgi:DNA mismatch repair protein MSH5